MLISLKPWLLLIILWQLTFEWDPTGRFVATTVTSVHEMENGFNIWSSIGKHLYRILKDNFLQFLWRPRPPSFLTPEKENETY